MLTVKELSEVSIVIHDNTVKYNILTLSIAKIIAFWNDPLRMQAMLNTEATNWPGDMYAMVQRQKELEAKSI